MTEHENLMEVIGRTGRAMWLPISQDVMLAIKSSADCDRPRGRQDGRDWFGCLWNYDSATGGYAQAPTNVVPPVVEDISHWRESLHLPELDTIDWAGAARRDLEGRDGRFLLLKTESGCFERLHQLTGFEEAFVAMYEEPEAFGEFMEALADFRIAFYGKLIDHYSPNALMVMDDLGGANGPLMSIGMYREMIKPHDKRIFDYIHSRGVLVFYHSCGCMEAFIEELLEMGADIIHPLQGGVNDQRAVQERYGDRACFCGGLDNLVHLPTTTAARLRQEVRRVMELFWEKKNLILMPRSFTPGYTEILIDEARAFNAEKLRGEK